MLHRRLPLPAPASPCRCCYHTVPLVARTCCRPPFRAMLFTLYITLAIDLHLQTASGHRWSCTSTDRLPAHSRPLHAIRCRGVSPPLPTYPHAIGCEGAPCIAQISACSQGGSLHYLHADHVRGLEVVRSRCYHRHATLNHVIVRLALYLGESVSVLLFPIRFSRGTLHSIVSYAHTPCNSLV